jgi:hypothetical protein
MMKRNVIIVIIALILIVYAVMNPIVMGLLALAVWIYLVFIGFKQRIQIFSHIEMELALKRFKLFKTLLVIAGVSLVLSTAGILIHNLVFGHDEEAISFFVGIIGLWIFIISTLVNLAIFVKSRL